MLKYFALIMAATLCSAPYANNISSTNATYKTPVIIDTDMGFDDWMAILYAAKDANIDIKAVTIDCSGETKCPKGAENATKLLKLATGRTDIPVYMQKDALADSWYSFPELLRTGVTSMQVFNYKNPKMQDFKNIKGYPYNTQESAAEAIYRLATHTKTPLTFISIGTAVNLSQAIDKANKSQDYQKFKDGFKMIYKGGATFGIPTISDGKQSLSNINIHGNISIPSIYSSNNNQAEWNIYAAAKEMENLVTSGLPLTFVPLNISDQVKITEDSYNKIIKHVDDKKDNAIKFVADDIINEVNQQGGWAANELDYWDPSVMVVALNPQFATQKFDQQSVCVASAGYSYPIKVASTINSIDPKSPIPVQFFELQDVSHSIYQYGTTLINVPFDSASNDTNYSTEACKLLKAHIGSADIFYSIDTKKFYDEFINTLST